MTRNLRFERNASHRRWPGRIAMTLIAAPIALLAAPPLLDRGGDNRTGGSAPRHANAPNIVMLLTDDLDVSVWDKALALGYLPRIRSDVIGKGVTLKNTFAATPVCCPSRTTLLTGQYPHNHGVLRNDGPKGGFAHFDNDTSTIAVWLHGAGYRTGILGKYLNGYTTDDAAYVAPGWDTWSVVLDIKEYNYRMSMNGTLVFHGDAPQDYQTDVLAGMARDFILTSDPRPFLLLLTPTAPHYEIGIGVDENAGTIIRPAPRHADTPPLAKIPPETLSSFNEPDMSDKPTWMQSKPLVDVQPQRDGYNSKIAAMRAVDDMLGTVVDALAQMGQLSNTLIIVTSDNGFQYGTHRLVSKIDLYEESIRLPMVIRVPGRQTPATVDDWAMNTDWAPTIVDYAGATATIDVDGRSLKNVLQGVPTANRRSMLVEFPPVGYAGGHPPYRMIRSKDPSLTGDSRGQRVLVYAETIDQGTSDTQQEFYDLSIDALQRASRHQSTKPNRKAQMDALQQRLDQLTACGGGSCQTLENGDLGRTRHVPPNPTRTQRPPGS